MSSMLVCVLSTLAAAPLPDGWQTRPLTDEDLIELSSEELRQLRNEIYARHGYVFKSADLAEHFRQQPWYKPKPAFNPAAAGAVSPEEKANVELIKRIEEGRREYEARDDRSQVFIKGGLPVLSEVKGALATIRNDGSLEASPYELSVRLSCRFDVKTPTSKKCDCGHRLEAYDHRLRIRAAAETAALPAPFFWRESGPGVPDPKDTLELALVDVDPGGTAGKLLEIRYVASEDIEPNVQRKWAKRARYFALDNDRGFREVADIQELLFQNKYGTDSNGNGTYFEMTSATHVDALPCSSTQPPTLRLTTRIKTMNTIDPPGQKSTVKRDTKQEVRMLPWSADKRQFKESTN